MKTQPSLGHLEQRIASQQRRINQGVAAGTLTKEQGASLSRKLENTQKRIEKDAFDGNGLTRGAGFEKHLDGLSKEIHADKHDKQMNPQARLENIDKRIENGLKDGSLTSDEASKLKSQSATLKQQLSQANTPKERDAIRKQLGQLSKSVHAERHNGTYDGEKRLKSFEDRISKGVADGSLTQAEADKLKGKLNGMKNDVGFGTSSAKDINSFSKQIFNSRHNGAVNAQTVQSSISTAIDAGLASGKLTQGHADELRSQLQSIGANTQAMGPRLNALREQLRAIA